MYKNVNMNPLNKKVGDCVIRALAKAYNKSWDDIYIRLCEIGLELKNTPSNDEVYKRFLKEKKAIIHKIKIIKGSKRETVKQFCNSNSCGTYILRIANHIVVVVDGCYYDTWDCGDKSVYTYWEIL